MHASHLQVRQVQRRRHAEATRRVDHTTSHDGCHDRHELLVGSSSLGNLHPTAHSLPSTRPPPPPPHSTTMRTAELTPEDEQYLAIGEDHRDRLMKIPMLSSFRVVAVFAYEDLDGNHKHIVGGNCECANIGGALCAERAAICQMQFLPVKRVRAVYIVSDADVCLTPGTLCREFLSSSPLFTPQTPFITRATKCKPCVTNLEELFPYPSVYSHVLRADVLHFGLDFVRKGLTASVASDASEADLVAAFKKQQLSQLSEPEQKAYLAACETTAKDSRDDLFPLRSAAAVLFSDNSVRVAWQHKTLEYGSSLDAISKLIAFIEDKADDVRPVMIVQVDQFGITHAPSARARAYFFEYGFQEVNVLIHDADAALQRAHVGQLVFESPDCIASTTACS